MFAVIALVTVLLTRPRIAAALIAVLVLAAVVADAGTGKSHDFQLAA